MLLDLYDEVGRSVIDITAVLHLLLLLRIPLLWVWNVIMWKFVIFMSSWGRRKETRNHEDSFCCVKPATVKDLSLIRSFSYGHNIEYVEDALMTDMTWVIDLALFLLYQSCPRR